jgi:glycerol-3-phosphate dehydrogenase
MPRPAARAFSRERRAYLLEANADAAPQLSVRGGKITTVRKLAEEAGDPLGQMRGKARRPWTRGALLPGGDFTASIGKAQRPDIDFARMLAAAMGDEVAPGLHEAKLIYLRAQEWALTAQDVLWQSSKLGLHYSVAERERVSDWMQGAGARQAPSFEIQSRQN